MVSLIILINDKICCAEINTEGTVYLSQISDLSQESLFKHGWVHLWCGLGFDAWV